MPDRFFSEKRSSEQMTRKRDKRYLLGINVRLTNMVERMAPWRRRRENVVVVFFHGEWLTTKQIKQKTAKNILSSLNAWSLLVVDRCVVSLVDSECNLYACMSCSSSSMDIDRKGNTSCGLFFAFSSFSPTSLSLAFSSARYVHSPRSTFTFNLRRALNLRKQSTVSCRWMVPATRSRC